MHPTLYSFDGITLYTYGLMISVGFLLSFVLFLTELKRRSLSVDTGIDFAFWVLLSAIAGSRLVYVLLNFSYFGRYPLKILMIWEGGLVWYGAFLGALAATLIYFRIKKLDGWLWADIAIPYVALGQGIGRIGCLMAGCCYGRPTDLPWGITFSVSEIAPLGVALHPTQVYEMLFNFMIFAVLFSRRNRAAFRGQQILSYVFLYGATRAIVEVFRGDPRGVWLGGAVSTSQLISAVAVAAGIILYFKIRVKNLIAPVDTASVAARGVRPNDPENKPSKRPGKKRPKNDRS
ncbi:MAG: prolipoprotein diacylglyceryl transferase [Deltaproteobacteria bacterium]|nr:prolipoprotein diacylglyceryl transferase [Candidatus Zymogenaceae bacterium]